MEYTIDAQNKKLGRVASQVAIILMGKNKSDFARNTIPSAKVCVLNAGKISVTNKKMEEKVLEEPVLRDLQLLTAKPQIYILNGEESEVSENLRKKLRGLGDNYLVYNLAREDNLGELIKKAYEILGLISFFTTGEDESRAWTIKRGAKAPEAAGEIHSDFEKKFIRAEVIGAEELLEIGSWQRAKQTGKLRLEGKEYEAKDGDVIEIRHG